MSMPRDHLDDAERERLRKIILRDGLVRVAAWIGVCRDSVGRAVAGLPVWRATIALIRARTSLATVLDEVRP